MLSCSLVCSRCGALCSRECNECALGRVSGVMRVWEDQEALASLAVVVVCCTMAYGLLWGGLKRAIAATLAPGVHLM